MRLKYDYSAFAENIIMWIRYNVIMSSMSYTLKLSVKINQIDFKCQNEKDGVKGQYLHFSP